MNTQQLKSNMTPSKVLQTVRSVLWALVASVCMTIGLHQQLLILLETYWRLVEIKLLIWVEKLFTGILTLYS